MPKLKTKSCLKKRVKVTANGKISRSKAFGSHLMSGKSGNRKRKLRKKSLIKSGYVRTLMRALGKC